jgi:hypothetical protein
MRCLRRCSIAAVAAVSLLLMMAPVLPALAQSNDNAGNDTPELVPVVIWTIVIVLLVLAVAALGYLFRRENGLDHPLTAPPIDPIAGMESHDTTRDAAGRPLPEHVLAEHAAARHDDATEQAELLVRRGHED